MVASSPQRHHHHHLIQNTASLSPIMPSYQASPKPTPPRTPPGGGPGGGRGTPAPSQSPPAAGRGHFSSPVRASHGGSVASRGSNNTRPSSSPEGRSVRTSGGSKGSVENQREGASVAGPVAPVPEGEQFQFQHPRTKEPRSPPGTGGGGALAPRASLAVNTGSLGFGNGGGGANNNILGGAPTGQPSPPYPVGPAPSPPKAAPVIPKNPKDTAAYVSPGGHGSVGGLGASPKRRMKSASGGSNDFSGDPFGAANFAGSGGGSAAGGAGRTALSLGGGTHGGATVKSAMSAKSVPVSYAQAAGMASPAAPPYGRGPPPGTPSSAPMSNPPGSAPAPGSVDSLHSLKDLGPAGGMTVDTDGGGRGGRARGGGPGRCLDDEEQFMFEQRLTQDELGVAIRKISHSGKAQLRYVKCVPIRPPSSSDFDDGRAGAGLGGAGQIMGGAGGARPAQGRGGPGGVSVPYLDAQAAHGVQGRPSPRPQGDSISVSSKSSTGSRFKQIMRNANPTSMRRLISNSNSVGGQAEGRQSHSTASGTAGGAGMIGSNSEDNLLLHDADKLERSLRALTWGKKNAVTLPLDKFTCVRKGKTTERTLRNSSPSSRLLSVMTCARGNESLDIEAPTMLDRDKFASAFARFLGVPLVEEGKGGRASFGGTGAKKKIRTPSLTRSKKNKQQLSAARSEPGPAPLSPSLTSTPKVRNRSSTGASDSLLPALTPNSDKASDADRELAFDTAADNLDGEKQIIGNTSRKADDSLPPPPSGTSAVGIVSPVMTNASSHVGSHAGDTAETMSKHTLETMSESARKRISLDGQQGESMLEPRTGATPPLSRERGMGTRNNRASRSADELHNFDPDGPTVHARKDPHDHPDADAGSHVSSLTGGVDQEIVEELHQAIIELRSELDASRAEAARAVKVAEQAIQSAENCTSSDWNSTVTHKAAEAAAQAQKKSAEAIARARMAEERLAAERRSTGFWRRQAQAAEEEAGSLKTRSAAAEVKRAVVMEELASERRKAARMFASLKSEFQAAERRQGEEMSMISERKRGLEAELEEAREEMERKERGMRKAIEAEVLQRSNEKPKGPNRMKPKFTRPRSHSRGPKEKKSGKSSPVPEPDSPENASTQHRCVALHKEMTALRKQFELVRHTSMDEILSLHRQSEEWSNQASRAVAASTAETGILREKLAAEGSMRLKLLNELQDLRGTVRVYCRPKPCPPSSKGGSIIKIPTHDTLVLNEDASPACFKYDRVFSPGASQHEVFSELEEPLVSSLDGFNVMLLAFGQGGSGKTRTLLGDVSWDDAAAEEGEDDSTNLPSINSHGVQVQAVRQLFTIAGHRTDRYKDTFSMTVVEVRDEKLHDLLAGTPSAEREGEMVLCETRPNSREKRRGGGEGSAEGADKGSWRGGKLEIRTDVDGNTIVQGLVSVTVRSFDDALTAWREAVARRAERLRSQGVDLGKHERKTCVITTVNITSVNIATGVGTEGKLQFVDMASSDVVRGVRRARDDGASASSLPDADDTRFANKSVDAFNDVICARAQFDRSVPYRNATLTHLLRDSLEADAKVLLVCCVSSERAHLADTLGALRFASRMQKVSIGKATKHIIGSKE